LNIINANEVANWVVDQNWGCSGCKDSSQFDGTSNKNGDNIGPGTLNWTYSINGQGPQKNDLTNLMMFLKRSGGETWLIGGAETRAANGDAHIDFEYNQAGVYTQGTPTNGYIKGNGPVGGRTVGDFIVCIDYENGGANPIFTLRVWNLPGQFDLVSLVPQQDYFFAANITNVPAVAPGRGVSTGGNATNTTTTLQFVEFALKSSVINALFNSPAACNTNATLNYKTRSSQSFTAELKDFRIMPIVITLPPDITCGPDQCVCQNTAGNTFNVAPTACDAAYTYEWTKVSSTGTLAVNIVSPSACSTAVNTTGYGTAVLKVKATKAACSDSCTMQIIVRPTPACSITVPGGPVCPNTVTTHSAPAGYDKYTWTVTGNASIVGSSSGQSVQVQAGAVCGSYTVNLEAGNNGCTAGSYCTSTCSQTVQVQDNNSPSISTLNNKTIACTDPIVWDTPTATDNCDPNPALTFASSTVTGNAVCRTLRRTWTATDACGNTSTRTQDITITDNVAPTISTLTNQTIACTDPIVWGTPTATDNCDPNPSLTFANSTVSGNAVCRTLRRTWTATDICGNTSTRTQDITITDNVAPSIGTLTNRSLDCGDPIVWDTPSVSDNCDPNPSLTFSSSTVSGNAVCRVLRRTWTATDICGNTSTRTQDITVTDNTAPSISALTNRSISCTDPIVWDTPTATDNCDPNPTLNFASSTVSGNAICRVLRRTWTATDICGNTSTRTQDITITDNVAPTITALTNRNISCTDPIVWDTPTASDNCDPNPSLTFASSTVSGNAICRTLRRTWTATDICGNTSTRTQDIVISDNTAPVLTVGANQTIDCSATPVWGTPTATDNCDPNVIITYNGETRTNGSCPQNYTLTRSWTATDLCGNTDTKTKSITFQDTQAPTITCPADKTLTCGATATFDPPTATDNCSTYTINTLGTDTTYNSSGSVTFRRRYNAVDACGNTSTECSQSVTVPACSRFCTYTQGAYGNAGGTHCNGQTTPAFVTGLLATPLTVGAGTKTITFNASDASCLISKLPAGGTAAVLGGSYTCATIQPINSGKIYNVLLGQTITLGLNMRINSGTLSSLRLTGRYIRNRLLRPWNRHRIGPSLGAAPVGHHLPGREQHHRGPLHPCEPCPGRNVCTLRKQSFTVGHQQRC
jgi:uncharacterized membrane protein